MDEGPIMAIRLNQNWINTFGLAAANQVLDAIATFDMSQGQRRDEQVLLLYFVDILNFFYLIKNYSQF